MKDRIIEEILSSAKVKNLITEDQNLVSQIESCASNCIDSLRNGGKIIFCGNGGSFSDSQHLSAELTGRYMKDRDPLASIALGTNTSSMSAIGNDYGYEFSFSRELEALGNKNDYLIAITTSGNSQNIIEVLKKAKSLDIKSVVLTGKDGGKVAHDAECIIVPSESTARIQESHIMIGQIICGIIEDTMFPS